MPQKTISILGCGYLGLPLAKALKSLGYKVKGSTTKEEKLPVLKAAGIDPYLIKIDSEINADRLKQFMTGHIIVVTLPFRKSFNPPDIYFHQVKAVVDELAFSPIDFMIFTSSTAVYPELNRVMKEGDRFSPEDPRAQTLLQTENLILESQNFKASILRLAGLYGDTRQLGNFHKGTPVEGGNKPVNLIHLEDAVQIIVQLIQHDLRGQVLNACSDDHPLKKDLYTRAAAHAGLPPPEFAKEEGDHYKIVSNEKLKKILGYQFLNPSPLEFPK